MLLSLRHEKHKGSRRPWPNTETLCAADITIPARTHVSKSMFEWVKPIYCESVSSGSNPVRGSREKWVGHRCNKLPWKSFLFKSRFQKLLFLLESGQSNWRGKAKYKLQEKDVRSEHLASSRSNETAQLRPPRWLPTGAAPVAAANSAQHMRVTPVHHRVQPHRNWRPFQVAQGLFADLARETPVNAATSTVFVKK